MLLWMTRFQTFRPMASLPCLRVIASERQDDRSYRHEGRFRQREMHCLFKYSLEGRGGFRDAAGEHGLPAGTGFLCEIRDPATAYYYPPDATEPWRFVYAAFDGPAATAMVREWLDRYGPIYQLPADAGIVPRLLGCRSGGGEEMRISPAEGAKLVFDLLAALAESKDRTAGEEPGNRLVLLAQEIVRENLDCNLNVSDLAARLNVSREHLTRTFREQTGQTPYRYVLREKMLLACRLLKETSLTNKEIAARLGYDAPAHFTRTFRTVMQMTPSRFRQVGVVPVR